MKKVIEELQARIELMEASIRTGEEMLEHHKERADKELRDVMQAHIKIAEYNNAINVLKAFESDVDIGRAEVEKEFGIKVVEG